MATTHGDQQNGQKLFTAKCGGCHTLAAAGTSGTIGPSLDDAFSGPKAQHFKESTLENVVLDQIREASAPMPTNLVKGQDAVDVAAYVAAVAGAGGANAKPPSQLGTDGKAIFSSQCSSCHTLKAAGATGTIGPNLDTLKPAFARVVRQVANGGSVMPAFKGKLTPAQIDAVAKFVSSSAGK
jgi:cbb3-type cytochrome c oxidase subunit III